MIKTLPVPIRISQVYGHISFQNVSFSYDTNRPTLCNLNLEVEPGKVIGIVGPSGAGKTTLVQLIPRFYDPIEGAVCIDGYDARQLDLQEMRGQISYMQQEAFIFSGSIFDNIAIGDADADAARVEAAARKACIHETISGLEQGYNTQVGERGSRLSQGQKQRIALARVLIRSSPIVILDEATSSLDVETESRIFQILREELADSTTIVITHRLSAIKDADGIIVLNEGSICEQGTYDRLSSEDTFFARMHARSNRVPGVPAPNPVSY